MASNLVTPPFQELVSQNELCVTWMSFVSFVLVYTLGEFLWILKLCHSITYGAPHRPEVETNDII